MMTVIRRREFLASLPLLPALARPAAAQSRFFLRDGDRVLFLGDSITQAGAYVEYIETFLLTRFPEERFAVVKLGLSSETVCGLTEPGHPFPRPNVHDRLEAALEKTRPTVVSACYGMNDGIYAPFSPERFRAFQAGMRKLVDQIRRAGARVVLLTPPPFEALPRKTAAAARGAYGYQQPYPQYDTVLARYGEWLRSLAGPEVQVIDLHGPLAAYAAERRHTQPDYALTRDGIHPGAAGHWLMAQAILEAWNAPAEVDAAEIDAAAQRVVAGQVANLDFRPVRITFSWRSRLPMGIDPRLEGETELVRGLKQRLNRWPLRMTHAPQPNYLFFEKDLLLGEAEADRLEAGLDMGRYSGLSLNRRAREVLRLVQERWAVLGHAWLNEVGHGRPLTPSKLGFPEARRRGDELETRARELSRPAEMQLKLIPQ